MGIEAELTLRKENVAYVAELRARQGEDSELRFGPFFVVIDADELADLEQEPERYGQALSEALFQENGLVWALGETFGIARGLNTSLRLRLFIDRSASELDSLRWELLRIPGTMDCLSTNEDILFSRYAPKRRDAPAPKPPSELRALAAISSPTDIQKKYNLIPLAEIFDKEFYSAALAGIPVDFLPESEGEHCTLELLARRIPGHDVLVLAAHSKRTPKGWNVLLQDANGKTRPVLVEKLCARLQGLRVLPRLVVVLGDDSAALAPVLMNELGIPAVIGMYGVVMADTARLFLTALFDALREDGAIDRAVAEARRMVGERCEEWSPVLYMSLSSGILWRGLSTPESGAAASQKEERGGAALHSLPPSPDPAIPIRASLYSLLSGPAFDLDDLEELCFFLQVDWDILRGQTHPAKARALIKHLEGRERLADLVAEIRRLRPGLKL